MSTQSEGASVENSKKNGSSTSSSSGSGVLRLSLCLMTLFLVVAAIVQMNDPDALLWMCIYLFPAFLTSLPIFSLRILDSGLWWLCVAGYLGAHSAFSFLFISVAYDNDNLSFNVVRSEEGRETCGLLIVAVWLLLLLSVGSRKCRPCQIKNPWVMGVLLVFAILPFLCLAAYKIHWQLHCELPDHCVGIF